MSEAWIGLGSNLDDPAQQIAQALQALAQLPHSRLLQSSPLYSSTAIGPGEQADYINAVVHLQTSLEPHALLARLQAIETAQGRTRTVRWGPRTLDLDILLYDRLELSDADLQIPHPRLAERNFVLYPLHDICPDLTLPNGTPLASLLARVGRSGLARLDPLPPADPR